MDRPQIIAIAALGKKTRFICHGDDLLWHNPKDLQRVKEETLNYPIIMGRKTHDSIGRSLPNRTNIILTRNTDYEPKSDDCIVVHTKEAAINQATKAPNGLDKIFIFGGAEIYKLFLDETEKLLLTLYDSQKQGTEKFPEYEHLFTQTERVYADTFEGENYEWINFVRKDLLEKSFIQNTESVTRK